MIFLLALCVWACFAKTQIISTKSIENDFILVPVASKSTVRHVERVVWCFAMQENQHVDNCEDPGLYRIVLPHEHVTKRTPSTVAIKSAILLNSKALERSLLEIHSVEEEQGEHVVEHVRFDSSVPTLAATPPEIPALTKTLPEKTMPVATPAPTRTLPEQTTVSKTPAPAKSTPLDVPMWQRYSGSGIFLFVGLGMVSLLAMLIHRVKYHSIRDNDDDPEASLVLRHPIMDNDDDFVVISKEERDNELQFLMQLGTGANPAFAQNL